MNPLSIAAWLALLLFACIPSWASEPETINKPEYDVLKQYQEAFKQRRPLEQHTYTIKKLPSGDFIVIWHNPMDSYELLSE